MSSTVVQISKKELTQVISNVVEQKLLELFGDPDEGLELKASVRRRLIRQQKAVAKGERGIDTCHPPKTTWVVALYSIEYLKPAAKEISKLDRYTAKRILDRIEWLSANLDLHKTFPSQSRPSRAFQTSGRSL